ncbi:MAG: hypothetical protein LIO79_02125 [Rikenellaceae bacterium]|nr:hypothetical protein [Rikenellaceae bacterium]
MSCDNCKKNNCKLNIGRGCCFISDGEDTKVSVCAGGSKLNAYDWLEDYPNNKPDDIFEIQFKNTRKGYYRNVNDLPLRKGDIVAVESNPGYDVGIVSLSGDIVYKQMKKTGFNTANAEFKKIYRKAKPADIEKWQEAIALEHPTMIQSRQIAADLNLNMKIGDVEYQGGKLKAIFYYIADERVDFRELIKIFAERFRIRIEMRQIGARQEAGRIGGIGSCGRELCCASWISNFVSVTTNSARVQEISLNPQKLAGQCGKLKCCLIYELDTYIDARKEFPRIHAPLEAMDANYHLVKTDIFNRTMYFSSDPHSAVASIPVSIERVNEIIRMNRKGKKVDNLVDYSNTAKKEVEPDYRNAVGEDSITRFDSGKKPRKNRNRKNQSNGNNDNNRKGERPAPIQGTASKDNDPPKRQPAKKNNKYRNKKPKNTQQQ